MLRITQLKIDILYWKEHKEKQEIALVKEAVLKKLKCKEKDIQSLELVRKSIDARKKQEIKYVYTVDVALDKAQEEKILARTRDNNISLAKKVSYSFVPSGIKKLQERPIVIGSGPAGLFCTLQLALAGYQPILLERGKAVEQRTECVKKFWETNQLEEHCNVQFGEGGAGTFSDGKLNTLVKDVTGRNKKVLEMFVEHGAPAEILYLHKPHIGTDKLRAVVKAIREHIIALGGEVRFESMVTDITIEKEKLKSITINERETLSCQVAVLAIGHSARDTFSLLEQKGVALEQKAFAIGVRIEHPQELINRAQYGENDTLLPAADYKLTHQAANGRSVYSFCMCPGGFVVNASSEPGRLVVNGMSNYDRAEQNANSALIVNVTPQDFASTHVLAGVEFQRKWEALAYQVGKGRVPTQLFGDFSHRKSSHTYGKIKPNIKGDFTFANLWECLPAYVCEALVDGIFAFDKKIQGYAQEEAILSGVETRTSSPIRIRRDDGLESNIKGLYPCGEGAGYAGGITSAAMDGLKVYEAIAGKYKRPV